MATIVLVHGAWGGGWAWKKVTPLLCAAGHEVYTPTLTGLSERFHSAMCKLSGGRRERPGAWRGAG